MSLPITTFRELETAAPSDPEWVKECQMTHSRTEGCIRGKCIHVLYDYPQPVLECLATYTFQITSNSENAKVYTKTEVSSWEKGKEGPFVVRKDVVSCHEYFRTAEGVDKKEIEVFPPTERDYVLFESRTFRSGWPQPQVSGTDLVTYFQEGIEDTLPYLQDIKNVEWRFENLHYLDKNAIEFAMKELEAKGFLSDIQPSYVVVREESGKLPLHSHQSLCVRLPQGAAVEADAPFESQTSYSNTFSLHNCLVTRNKVDQKKALFPAHTLSASDALKQIATELAYVARTGSLVRRYAFNIVHMNGEEQQKLKTELEALGYTVTVDTPFLSQDDGAQDADLIEEEYVKQYLYIDLPR